MEQFLEEINELIQWNDGEFKQHLDHYKYFERYSSGKSPEHSVEFYRAQAEEFLIALIRIIGRIQNIYIHFQKVVI